MYEKLALYIDGKFVEAEGRKNSLEVIDRAIRDAGATGEATPGQKRR